MTERILLEICVASVDDAGVAVANGADRLELNCALALGGLTPSIGLMAEVRREVQVPVIAMVRPRPGGFCYSATEFDVMVRDAEALLAAGADGLAVGILTPDGRIDRERCRSIRRMCGNRPAVFHRAFDMTPDPVQALGDLIDLGFTRVLTSGHADTALNGAPLLANLVRQAAGRIEVLAGGGINAGTAPELVRRTGCNQVHASARARVADPSIGSNTAVRFNSPAVMPEGKFERTDPQAVAALRAATDASRKGC